MSTYQLALYFERMGICEGADSLVRLAQADNSIESIETSIKDAEKRYANVLKELQKYITVLNYGQKQYVAFRSQSAPQNTPSSTPLNRRVVSQMSVIPSTPASIFPNMVPQMPQMPGKSTAIVGSNQNPQQNTNDEVARFLAWLGQQKSQPNDALPFALEG